MSNQEALTHGIVPPNWSWFSRITNHRCVDVFILFYFLEIADKTAAFVSGSGTGAQLEERLRQSEKNNAKFSFLNPTDPFHAYYQFKVQEAKSGNGKDIPSWFFSGLFVYNGLNIKRI